MIERPGGADKRNVPGEARLVSQRPGGADKKNVPGEARGWYHSLVRGLEGLTRGMCQERPGAGITAW